MSPHVVIVIKLIMKATAFRIPSTFRFQIRHEPLNLSRLQYMIDTGRLDSSKPIKMDSLYWSGAVGKIEHGVKLLGDVGHGITAITRMGNFFLMGICYYMTLNYNLCTGFLRGGLKH